MTHITFVKKILANGELCKKCQEVSERMSAEGILGKIDHIVIADIREADSPGMILANKYQLEQAPFFVVEEDGEVRIFDIYFKFRNYLLEHDGRIEPKLNASTTTV